MDGVLPLREEDVERDVDVVDHQVLDDGAPAHPRRGRVVPVEGDVDGIPHDSRNLGDDRVEPLDVPDADRQPGRDPADQLLALARRRAEGLLDQGVHPGGDDPLRGLEVIGGRDHDRDALGFSEEFFHRAADLRPGGGGDLLGCLRVQVVDVGRPDLLELGVDPDMVPAHDAGADDACVHLDHPVDRLADVGPSLVGDVRVDRDREDRGREGLRDRAGSGPGIEGLPGEGYGVVDGTADPALAEAGHEFVP